MQFKNFRDLKLSLHPSKYAGRWKSIQKDSSDIILYIHHISDNPSIDEVSNFILQYFLVEYLCSCIFRGNRLKKNCTDRKTKNKPQSDCIPLLTAEQILDFLYNPPEFSQYCGGNITRHIFMQNMKMY